MGARLPASFSKSFYGCGPACEFVFFPYVYELLEVELSEGKDKLTFLEDAELVEVDAVLHHPTFDEVKFDIFLILDFRCVGSAYFFFQI